MNTGVISVRYARALMKSIADQTTKQAVYADMQTLAQSYLQVPGLRKAIDNPMLPKDRKEMLLCTACGNTPSPQTVTFIKVVLKEGREDLIQFMANAFVTLYRQEANIVSGRLVTAVSVDALTESRMKQLVQSRTNATVELKTEVNPDIIGGFILEYDTYRLDASIQSQLRSILKELK